MDEMKYMVGAVDFIIDREGEPVFIEANSSPGAKLLKAEGYARPLEALAGEVLARVAGPVAAIPIHREERDEGSDWKVELLSRSFPTHLIYVEDQDYSRPELVSVTGERFTPNVILYNIFEFAQLYSGSALQFNSREAIRVTMDKNLTMMVVKNGTCVRTPEDFLVFSPENAARFFRNKPGAFVDGAVIKPLFGWGGRRVHVWDKPPTELPKFRSARTLQSRVPMLPREGMFWDVRAYVVGGKFCGAVSRICSSPIVNLRRGGQFCRAEKGTAEKLKEPAEEIAREIDRVAQCLSGPRQGKPER